MGMTRIYRIECDDCCFKTDFVPPADTEREALLKAKRAGWSARAPGRNPARSTSKRIYCPRCTETFKEYGGKTLEVLTVIEAILNDGTVGEGHRYSKIEDYVDRMLTGARAASNRDDDEVEEC